MIKRFISYYKPYKLLFFLDLAAALGMSGIMLVYPVVTTKIIDELIPQMAIQSILINVAVLLFLYLIGAGLSYFMHYWGHVIGVRMEADMRDDMFTHMQKLPFSFYDNNRTGKLMSRVINDLNEVSELAHHGPEDLFIALILFTGSFIILFRQEWRLAMPVYLIVLPLIIVFTIKQRKKMSHSFRNVREKTADINAQLENALSGIREAKSYTNEEYEVDRFAEGNEKFRTSKNDALKALAVYATGMGFLIDLLTIMVLGFGGFFAYKQLITVGELTGFLLFINLMTQPVRRLTNFTQQFESGMNGFMRFDEIMQESPEDNSGEIVLKNPKGDIIMNSISFQYNSDETVIKNLSMHIENGKTTALVGPSGGGKTTLCRLIPGFYRIQAGSITIDSINIENYTLESLRKNIGVVQQDVFLFTGTIRDNILYGNINASQQEIERAAKDANIHDFIMSLTDGYDTWIGEKGIRLSGGQKQRVSIARVFLKNPPILILDEATSALDNETEIAIQRSLEKLLVGRTTIVIAHRLSTIRNADKIVVLSEKGIEEEGTHDSLYAMENGIYKKLYDAQFYAEQNSEIQHRLNS
ncbi:MAG: ABC transporter ATP-binding protein [Eubacteriales bacterium]